MTRSVATSAITCVVVPLTLINNDTSPMMFTAEQLADKWFFVRCINCLCGILFNNRLWIIVMADPVSINASCGVLLHKMLTKIGVNVLVVDDFWTPQGSSPSSDPPTRKNDVWDNHVFDDLIVHT